MATLLSFPRPNSSLILGTTSSYIQIHTISNSFIPFTVARSSQKLSSVVEKKTFSLSSRTSTFLCSQLLRSCRAAWCAHFRNSEWRAHDLVLVRRKTPKSPKRKHGGDECCMYPLAFPVRSQKSHFEDKTVVTKFIYRNIYRRFVLVGREKHTHTTRLSIFAVAAENPASFVWETGGGFWCGLVDEWWLCFVCLPHENLLHEGCGTIKHFGFGEICCRCSSRLLFSTNWSWGDLIGACSAFRWNNNSVFPWN